LAALESVAAILLTLAEPDLARALAADDYVQENAEQVCQAARRLVTL
jgi:hypothetical protein